MSFPAKAGTVLVNTTDVAAIGPAGPAANGTVTAPSVNAPITVPLSVTCSVLNAEAIGAALAAAQTPQQAARLFAKLISPALGQAVANAVQQALEASNQSSVNQPASTSQIQGWPQLVAQNGLALTLDWPSPGLATAGNLPVSVLQARVNVMATPQANGVPATSSPVLTVSVSGTF
jgi:hypothetical protein